MNDEKTRAAVNDMKLIMTFQEQHVPYKYNVAEQLVLKTKILHRLFPDFRDELIADVGEFVVFLSLLFNSPLEDINTHLSFPQHGLELCQFGFAAFL